MAATLQKNGVEYQDDYTKWCVSNEAHDPRFARSIDRFLKGLPHCTAVVCCNYMIYRLVRQVLEKTGQAGAGGLLPGVLRLLQRGLGGRRGLPVPSTKGFRIGQEVASRLMRMIRSRDCDDLGYTYVLAPEIYLGRTVAPV